jgi:H+-transporting ATPase
VSTTASDAVTIELTDAKKDADAKKDEGTQLERKASETIIKATRANSNAKIKRESSSIEIVKKNSQTDVMLSMNVDIIEDDLFVYSHGLTEEEALRLLDIHGQNLLPEKKTPKWYIFVSLLWQPMPCMIWLAIIIEAAIENWIDMSILIFIQFANASIAFYETTKAADAVDALKKSLQPKATVKRDGAWKEINAAFVVPGDMVLLASGSAIPADCRVNKGTIDVDQAALTGESLPVTMHQGDSCKMGSTVVRGETDGTVEFTGINTFFGKTAALLGGGSEVSNMQKMLFKIVAYLVIISVVLCIAVLIYVSVKVSFPEALAFVVVLMVASIPLAIEIVTTTTLALGSKELVHHGAIVTRLAAIEDLAGMAILCSDKTGTLTLNKMEIQEHTPIYTEGENQYTLLRYAAMAAKWKEPPRDALDTLTLGAVDLASLNEVEQVDYMPFDPIVKRTEGTIKEKGKTFKTSKGAPHIILKLVEDSGGIDHDTIMRVDEDVQTLGERGIRAIAVAKTDDNGVWHMMGLLTFLDPPRPDSKKTIETARAYGVAVKMITGDHLLIARETGKQLSLGTAIRDAHGLPLLNPETKQKPENLGRDYGDICLAADGFAQVFPEHKYLIVECLRELGYKVGMTGDGVNDAPALKRADVGVAVDGATDAAKAAADIVLTQPGLNTIIEGILVSRRIWQRIRSFLLYRCAATLQLLVFFFIAVFAFEPSKYMPDGWENGGVRGFPDSNEWPPFFHMPVLMLMLITLLNDGTLITIGYDYAVPSQNPPKWNLRYLFAMASVLGAVAMVSSLILLHILLTSWEHGSFLRQLGIGGISYGKVTTAIYLKVSASDFLTLFSARAGGDWFWKVKPAPILLAGGLIALTASTLLAMFWPRSNPDKILTVGMVNEDPAASKGLVLFVWIWSLVWWFAVDAAKVGAHYLIYKYNIFGVNDVGVMQLTPEAVRIRKEIEDYVPPKTGGHH